MCPRPPLTSFTSTRHALSSRSLDAGGQPPAIGVATTMLSLITIRETVTSVSTKTVTACSTLAAPNTSAVDVGVQTPSGSVNLSQQLLGSPRIRDILQSTDRNCPAQNRWQAHSRVETTVVNNKNGGIDPTCSWPVATKVVDWKERQFDAVDDLYKIDGNPGCNDLQAGFDSPMTWIFEVPVDVDVAGCAFRDTDLNNTLPQDADWAVVRAPESD